MFTGDEYYDDIVTSFPIGYSFLDDDLRYIMTLDLISIGHDEQYLATLDDTELDDLYEAEFG